MKANYLKTIAAALFLAATASAQKFDTSGNGTLRGDYFVREVLTTGTSDGAVTAAGSAIGVVTFDGQGNYTFKGHGTTLAGGTITTNTALALTGAYQVAPNGFLVMQSLADPADYDFGGVSGIGGVSGNAPSAFVASATEGTNVTLLIGIPAGAKVSNSALSGSYTAGAIDFPGASIAAVREASFNLTADGAGNMGSVAVSGVGANLGGTPLNQTVHGVTYSLSGEGSGTIDFGAAQSAQLVSGGKTFYISADGNIILGGSPAGFDVLVGIRSLTGASNATANAIYYLGALEEQVDTTGLTANSIDAFYGSANANGAGTSLFHNRIQALTYAVYDYTFDSDYTVQGNGTIAPADLPYQFTLGANGKAFIALGTATGAYPLYSLTLGLATQTYSGSGVYLNPLGVVSSANFAPITNPIAPNEFISLFGTGMAGGTVEAKSLPLPTTLGNVQVTVNGIAAPLDYVSPTMITALVPSSISPLNNVLYATVQVSNNGALSNPVTVYTSNTAPGVFAQPVGIGPAAAQHADYSAVSSSSPAKIGETIVIYAGGLGAVTPAVAPDGGPALSSPPYNTVDAATIHVDFSLVPATTIDFAGLTPTAAGLYQINVPIPAGTASNVFVNVRTQDGVTSEATLSVTSATAMAAAKASVPPRSIQRRLAPRRSNAKKAGLSARAPEPS